MPTLRAPQPFEELDHTADAGVRVRGQSAEEALARLVLAFSTLVTGGAPVREQGQRTVRIAPGDAVFMAVDVLRELLFVFEREGLVPTSCAVSHFDESSGARLCVGLGAQERDAHDSSLALKAVTLHEARFEREGQGWVAQVVFDV
jgi:SHS2 domain-containing protein